MITNEDADGAMREGGHTCPACTEPQLPMSSFGQWCCLFARVHCYFRDGDYNQISVSITLGSSFFSFVVPCVSFSFFVLVLSSFFGPSYSTSCQYELNAYVLRMRVRPTVSLCAYAVRCIVASWSVRRCGFSSISSSVNLSSSLPSQVRKILLRPKPTDRHCRWCLGCVWSFVSYLLSGHLVIEWVYVVTCFLPRYHISSCVTHLCDRVVCLHFMPVAGDIRYPSRCPILAMVWLLTLLDSRAVVLFSLIIIVPGPVMTCHLCQ